MNCVRKVYADHAATTPVHPEVAARMGRFLSEEFGNPSSPHSFGRAARRAVEEARAQVAALIGAQPRQIFFTSGGTEADNWALCGAALAARARGRHIITTEVEHHAVLDCAEQLARAGFRLTLLPVDRYGRVDPDQVAAAVAADTVLVSVILCNNEIGTVNRVADIARAVKQRAPTVVVHTDAVQACGLLEVDVNQLGVDLLSLSSHKIYGPKGVGALFVGRGFPFQPLLWGGSQERRLRPGTENLAGIVGFGQAAALARAHLAARAAHAAALRDRFLSEVCARIAGSAVNGDPAHGHPGIANITIPGVDAEAVLLSLDLKGVAAAAGSACSAGSIETSHVIRALGASPEQAAGALRFSFGQTNDTADIDYILEVLPPIVARLQRLAAGRP